MKMGLRIIFENKTYALKILEPLIFPKSIHDLYSNHTQPNNSISSHDKQLLQWAYSVFHKPTTIYIT